MKVQHMVTITLQDAEIRNIREALGEVLWMTTGQNFRSDPTVLQELLGKLATA